MTMKRANRCGARTLACLMLAGAPALVGAAPVPLSESVLARVTAGATGSDAAAENQARVEGPRHDAGDATLVAGAGAEARVRERHLTSVVGAQTGVAALRLENLSGSDAVSGLNVVDQGSARSSGALGQTVRQSNLLAQLGGPLASLQDYRSVGGFEVVSEQSGVETQRSQGLVQNIVQDYSFQRTGTHSTIQAAVDYVPLLEDGFVIDLNAGNGLSIPDFSIGLPEFFLDTIRIGERIIDEVLFFLPEDGAAARNVASARVNFSAGDLQLGEIRLLGNDVVIGPSVLRFPEFSIGDVAPPDEDGEGGNASDTTICRGFLCLFAPNGFNVGQVRIDDNEVSLAGRVIEGANPIPGIVGYGGGMALVGSGSIASEDGSARLQTTLTLSLGDIGNRFIDFIVPWSNIRELDDDGELGSFLDGGINQDVRLSLAGRRLPDIELELDLQVPIAFPEGFTGSFDGSICVSLSDCGIMTMENLGFSEIDRSSVHVDVLDSFAWRDHENREIRTEWGGVTLAAARADAIVVDGSTYEKQAYRIVEVSAGAQADMRLLHGANTAATVLANGINVGRLRTGDASGMAANQFQQSNNINQIGRW